MKPIYVTADRSEQLCRVFGESGKYGQSHQTQQHINQIADRSKLHSQHIYRKIDGQVGKEIGTGLTGILRESGPKMQVTAAIIAINTIVHVLLAALIPISFYASCTFASFR